MHDMENLSIKTSSHFLLVTVCNYDVYQGGTGDGFQTSCQASVKTVVKPVSSQPGPSISVLRRSRNQEGQETPPLPPTGGSVTDEQADENPSPPKRKETEPP